VPPEATVFSGLRRSRQKRRKIAGLNQVASQPRSRSRLVERLAVPIDNERGWTFLFVEQPRRQRTEAKPEKENAEQNGCGDRHAERPPT
jgi:hypothetical protein